MSTVAYKDGVWAYDTRATGKDYIDGSVQKAFETDVPGLSAGVVGDLDALTRLRFARYPRPNYNTHPASDPLFTLKYVSTELAPFLRDVINESKEPDTAVLVVFQGDVFLVESDGAVMEIRRGWHAIGSGMMAALGVMSCGQTALQAVTAASAFDVYTSHEVEVFNV